VATAKAVVAAASARDDVAMDIVLGAQPERSWPAE
jgi:hypothetical protein